MFYFSHFLNPLVFCFSLELVVSSGSVLNTWTIELFLYRKVNVAKYNLQASKAPFSLSFSSCFSSALFCRMDTVQLSLTLDCQQFLLKANNPIFMLQVTCIPVQCCTHEGDKLFWSITFAELDPSVHRNTKCLPFVMNSTPTLFSMGVLFSGNCSSSNSDSIW